MIQDSRTCPRCKRGSGVMLNSHDCGIMECIFCQFAWKRYGDGSWRLVINQDPPILALEVSCVLYTWEEARI